MKGFALIAALMSQASVGALAQSENAADDEIIVTAQKREQRLVDVPVSIAVVDGEALERTRTQDLFDLARLAPSFSIQRQGATDTIFIRGVGGGGRNVGFSTRAGVYVDGVYAGQFTSANQDALDIERVEVLRGPQGQLFGRNTVSGAVNITSAAPSQSFGGYVEGGYGRRDLVEFRGALNAPLGDRAAIRISASHRERDGFTINLPTGTDLDNINRDSVRARLTVDLSERLTADFAGDFTDDRTNKAVGEAITDTFGTGPSPAPGAFDTPYNIDPSQVQRGAGGSMTLNYDLGDATLTSITAYRNTSRRRVNDLDYVPLDFFGFDFKDRYKQLSQELRAAFGGDGPLSGVVGLYYFSETGDNERSASAGAQIGLTGLPLVPGVIAAVDARVKTRSYAAFGAVDWKFAERITLNIGGRFTHDDIELIDYSTFGPAVFALATIPNFDDSQSSDSFDPTAGLTFALSEQANLYAKYARGFKSGGWNVDFISAADFAASIRFKPERVNSYEGGLKYQSADRSVRFNLAAYYAAYDDYQINQFVDLGGGQTSIQLRNAAKAVTWGGEADVAWRASARLDFNAAIGFVRAVFDRFPNGGGPGVDLDGNRLPYAPSVTASAGALYAYPLSGFGALNLGANWSYRSKSFSGPENLARQQIDARHLVDARLELAADAGWSVALWARNIFDEAYIDNRIFDFFQTDIVERGEPRTFGATLRAAF